MRWRSYLVLAGVAAWPATSMAVTQDNFLAKTTGDIVALCDVGPNDPMRVAGCLIVDWLKPILTRDLTVKHTYLDVTLRVTVFVFAERHDGAMPIWAPENRVWKGEAVAK